MPHAERFDPGVPPERAAREFHETLRKRRSVRAFSDRPVSRETVEWIVRCAAPAPGGAHRQPRRFVCAGDPALKREIRLAVEGEEREFHTPAPRRFLEQVLGRPAHERASMLVPLGYPAEDCLVPARALERRPLEEGMVVDRGVPSRE